jgi:hypothetical protein
MVVQSEKNHAAIFLQQNQQILAVGFAAREFR